MRFGKQLEIGTYEPWKDQYIQYNKLKRIIRKKRFILDQKSDNNGVWRYPLNATKELSNTNHSTSGGKDSSSTTERTGLLSNYGLESDYYSVGTAPKKFLPGDSDTDFFGVIQQEIDKINKFFVGQLAELRISLDQITSRRRNVYFSHHTSAETDLVRLRDIYVQLAALRSYCDLNQTGFIKIIKKHDKMLEEKTLDAWIPIIERQTFATSPEPVQLMDIVTSLVSRDKLIEWETFATETKLTDDSTFPAVRVHGLLISILVFLISLTIPIVTPNDPAASRCLSVLLFVITLWVTEALPYYGTALLIPALVVVMGVLKDTAITSKTGIMSTEASAAFVTSHIFNHTTWLLLGGYTISTAFARCELELRIASFMQLAFGHRPKMFMLATMLLGLFLSMWINNHTAPILCVSILLPVLRDLPSDSKFSKSLLLGLAFACNFGGMLTPIASLQNALAVSYLEQAGIQISFGKWMLVALPFGLLCTITSWILILLIMRPDDVTAIPLVVYERGNIFTKKNVAVILSSLVTILLFSTSSLTKKLVGDISIISLLFAAFMFGTGILTEVDFNSLSWHTLCLVGGGNVLGKAVESSGLLEYLADGITNALPLSHPWISLLCILMFCGGIATFVSHTVAAIILMPIIARIGITLAIPEVIVVGSAFAVSAAMALPFSSFPNVNSLLVNDDFRRPYLSTVDFIWCGVPMSIITIVLIATVGFGLISVILGV